MMTPVPTVSLRLVFLITFMVTMLSRVLRTALTTHVSRLEERPVEICPFSAGPLFDVVAPGAISAALGFTTAISLREDGTTGGVFWVVVRDEKTAASRSAAATTHDLRITSPLRQPGYLPLKG